MLTHLGLSASSNVGVDQVLSTIGPSNIIREISLYIDFPGTMDEKWCALLDNRVSSLPMKSLPTLELHMPMSSNYQRAKEVKRFPRRHFPKLTAKNLVGSQYLCFSCPDSAM